MRYNCLKRSSLSFPAKTDNLCLNDANFGETSAAKNF